jgi:hypothetical protein
VAAQGSAGGVIVKGIEKTLVEGTGFPWPGGPEREFAREEVVAFGKLTSWGDFVTRYWVRLAGGTELHVNASKESKDNERWLRRLAKKVPYVGVIKEIGWAASWIPVRP